MHTPWDPLQRAYFNGEAVWTYLTTPFLLAMDGVRVEETETWREGAETWSVLRAYFPGWMETHCMVQDFFFGEDMMLRRHDYSVNVAGGFPAAQLTSSVLTLNCPVITHAASTLSRAARARLIFSRIAAPSAFQV